MNAPAEMRGVVNVAVLDYIVWMLQRRNVERLGLPRAIGHSPIGELCNESAVAGMPGVALKDLHPKAQLVFPVLGLTAFVFFSIGVRVGYRFAPEKRVFRG